MLTVKNKETSTHTMLHFALTAGMAMMILATLFLASCADYSGMMDMEPEEDTFLKAVKRGDIPAAKKFLENGADINARDSSKNTALQIAVRNVAIRHVDFRDNDIEMVRMLIKAGADLTLLDQSENNIVGSAVEYDASEAVEVLIEAGAEIEVGNKRGETPLFYAAAYGRKALPILIQAGADVNTANNDGDTALMYAAKLGEVEAIRLLIEAGANVNLAGPRGDTALIYAAGINRSQMSSYEVDETMLAAMVELFLAAGADVEASTNEGVTALIAAAQEGHLKAAELLINAGANLNAKTAVDGFTPLMEAAKAGYANMVSLLLEAGADPTLTDRVGRSAVEWGADYPDIVVMLGGTPAKTTAPVREVTSEQREQARQTLFELGYRDFTESMFVMSTGKGELEAVKAFLDYGLSVDSKDPRDHATTPLLVAASLETPDIGLLLIEAGADVNAKDTNGSTPLIWAAQKCGLQELVKALVEAGADVNAKAAGGATPLMMAETYNCSENIAILKNAGAKK